VAHLRAIDIPAPHGLLEGLLRTADEAAGPPAMAALVCHPHPLYGGSMHTKVVFRIAQTLADLGIPTLRFNFRGVGRSTGFYDDGAGESEDVHTALDALARLYPGTPLCLAGFSFGAWVGLPVGCADARVTQIIGVGVPAETLMRTYWLPGCDKPKLIVQGSQDEYGSEPQIREWVSHLSEPKSLVIVPGSDHFFTGYQTQLAEAIHDYFTRRA
jgi:uncharacterized protein